MLDMFQSNLLCKYIPIVYRCARSSKLQEVTIERLLLVFRQGGGRCVFCVVTFQQNGFGIFRYCNYLRYQAREIACKKIAPY